MLFPGALYFQIDLGRMCIGISVLHVACYERLHCDPSLLSNDGGTPVQTHPDGVTDDRCPWHAGSAGEAGEGAGGESAGSLGWRADTAEHRRAGGAPGGP